MNINTYASMLEFFDSLDRNSMTYQDALKFFATFGNVDRDADNLATERPTSGHLAHAVFVAVHHHHQPREIADAARWAIIEHWEKVHAR